MNDSTYILFKVLVYIRTYPLNRTLSCQDTVYSLKPKVEVSFNFKLVLIITCLSHDY